MTTQMIFNGDFATVAADVDDDVAIAHMTAPTLFSPLLRSLCPCETILMTL